MIFVDCFSLYIHDRVPLLFVGLYSTNNKMNDNNNSEDKRDKFNISGCQILYTNYWPRKTEPRITNPLITTAAHRNLTYRMRMLACPLEEKRDKKLAKLQLMLNLFSAGKFKLERINQQKYTF